MNLKTFLILFLIGILVSCSSKQVEKRKVIEAEKKVIPEIR